MVCLPTPGLFFDCPPFTNLLAGAHARGVSHGQKGNKGVVLTTGGQGGAWEGEARCVQHVSSVAANGKVA